MPTKILILFSLVLMLASQFSRAANPSQTPLANAELDSSDSAVRIYLALVRLRTNSSNFTEKDSSLWFGNPKDIGFLGFTRAAEQKQFSEDLRRALKDVQASGIGVERHEFDLASTKLKALLDSDKKLNDAQKAEAKTAIETMIRTLDKDLDTGVGLGPKDSKLIIAKAVLESKLPYQKFNKEDRRNGTDIYRPNLQDDLKLPVPTIATPSGGNQKTKSASLEQPAGDGSDPTPAFITNQSGDAALPAS